MQIQWKIQRSFAVRAHSVPPAAQHCGRFADANRYLFDQLPPGSSRISIIFDCHLTSANMGPPPRPPIICYDLTTDKNHRPPKRHPIRTLPQRSAVTVIRPEVAQPPRRPNPPRPIIRPRMCSTVRAEQKHQSSVLVRLKELEAGIASAGRTWTDLYQTIGSDRRTVKSTREQEEETARIEDDKLDRIIAELEAIKSEDEVSELEDVKPESETAESQNVKPHDEIARFEDIKLEDEMLSTLEITDAVFFEKMEDQTMIEVNKLYQKMQSTLKELDRREVNSRLHPRGPLPKY